MNPLVKLVKTKMNKVVLGNWRLLDDCYDSENFGNAEAIFDIDDSIRLHFIRERGQDFVEFGCVDDPNRFYLFDDVFVAMGWESIDNVLGRKAPITLDCIFDLIQQRIKELKEAFSTDKYDSTRMKIESIEKMRGEKFLKYFSKETTI